MERKLTVYHFITAAGFLWFGIVMLILANGGIIQASPENAEIINYHATVPMYLIPFAIICFGTFSIIVNLNDDPETIFVHAGYTAICAGLPLAYFLNLSVAPACFFAAFGGIYYLCYTGSSFINAWSDDYVGLSLLSTLVSVVIAAAFICCVPLWASLPSFYNSAPMLEGSAPLFCQWGGYLSIGAAVALCVNGIVWHIKLNY